MLWHVYATCFGICVSNSWHVYAANLDMCDTSFDMYIPRLLTCMCHIFWHVCATPFGMCVPHSLACVCHILGMHCNILWHVCATSFGMCVPHRLTDVYHILWHYKIVFSHAVYFRVSMLVTIASQLLFPHMELTSSLNKGNACLCGVNWFFSCYVDSFQAVKYRAAAHRPTAYIQHLSEHRMLRLLDIGYSVESRNNWSYTSIDCSASSQARFLCSVEHCYLTWQL
jgi:hypothetical protein